MAEPSELEMKARELDLRERELDLAAGRARAERWRNPLTVAVIAAALAGFSNAYIAYANNQAQVALETSKAESARILEVLKIGEPSRVRENLHFLVQLGLVQSEPLKGRLEAWDANPRRAPAYLSPGGPAAVRSRPGAPAAEIPKAGDGY
jgi:hypothetical protein